MKKKSSQAGRLFLILFALPFAGIGIFATVMAARALWTWNDMRGWVPRPASILHAELETRRGDDSSSYLAIARYEYEFNGRKYQGTRVGVHTHADSVGSFHQRAVDQLKQHRKSGQPFTCYVDPGHPANSVLYRQIRIELLGFFALFALLFGGVGFGLLFWSIYSVKLERKENALVARHADQPWMWKPDWSAGQIKSSTKTAMFVALGFATFWNLISAPVVFFVPDEVRQGNHLALLALVFPLVGAGLMIWALRSVLQWLKYRDSVFQMASVPGVVGGQLAGVVKTRRNLNPPDGFHVTLSCINRVTTGSGKNRSTSERVVWQDVQQLERELAEHDLSQSVIPIQFQIPYESRETSDENPSSKIIWRLEVRAAVTGTDYAAAFDVPVFKTSESSPDYHMDTSAIAPYRKEREPAEVLAESGIRVEHTAGGKRWVFPPARHIGSALGLTVFLLIWLGAIVLMIHLGAPLFFPIIFGLFGLLLVWGVLDMWLWSCRIDASQGSLTVTSGILGLRRTRTFTADQIDGIQPTLGMQMGNKLFYGVKLATRDGAKHTIGKRLLVRSDAELLAGEILGAVNG